MKQYILLTFAFINLITLCLNATDDELFKAARSNDRTKVQALLKEGARPSATDWCGATPLHYAYYNGQELSSDALKSRRSLGEVGSTPQLLISFGANPNAQDIRLNTPLHTAVRAFSKSGIEQLIEAGAQVDVPNVRGETPLFLAVKKDAWQLIPTLIEAGASLDVTDTVGNSLMQIAANRNARTRNALVTSVSPKDVQHILPAIIVLTNPKDDPSKRTLFGKDIGPLIALRLIPEIMREKLTLGATLLPQARQQELQAIILQNITRMIAKSPRM